MCDSGDGLPGGGRLAGLTAADCYACPVGQFAAGDNYTCSACPAGSFADEVRTFLYLFLFPLVAGTVGTFGSSIAFAAVGAAMQPECLVAVLDAMHRRQCSCGQCHQK